MTAHAKTDTGGWSMKMTARERDEMLLDWLHLRDRGFSFQSIADRTGYSKNAVRVAVGKTNREYRHSEEPV